MDLQALLLSPSSRVGSAAKMSGAQPYYGEIRVFFGDFAIQDWAFVRRLLNSRCGSVSRGTDAEG